MIPPFNSDGNLPEGIHLVPWGSFSSTFGGSAHRDRLIGGLAAAMSPLRDSGCARLYVDGSFVTSKVIPNDYDVAWGPQGVDLHRLQVLEPLFFDFANLRAAQKAKYYGELFLSSVTADPAGNTFLEFFRLTETLATRRES